MKKNTIKAFSLLELSVVLVIVSILVVGGVGLGVNVTKNVNKKEVESRLDVLERSLANFVLQNGRLPCPASLTATPANTAYGTEVGSVGDCSGVGVYENSAVNSNRLIYGAVPFAALGLNPSYGRDPWGRKISYIVDKRLTIAENPTGFDFTNTPAKVYNGTISERENVLITIRSGDNNQDITNKAVYVLVSHGENGQGAFMDTSGFQITDAPTFVAEEESNIYDSSFLYDAVFILNKGDGIFDDLVRFKSKVQLLKDAGRKYIPCPETDSLFTDTLNVEWFWGDTDRGTSPNNANDVTSYGVYEDVTTGDGCKRKFCEGYGMWSFTAHDCSGAVAGGSCFGLAALGGDTCVPVGDGTPGEEIECPGCFCQNEDVISDGTDTGIEDPGLVVTPLPDALRDGTVLKYWINLTEDYAIVLDELGGLYKVNDSSKNCNRLRQVLTESQPSFTTTLEGSGSYDMPALYFDGIDDYMDIDLMDIVNHDYTIFIVDKRISSGQDGLLASGAYFEEGVDRFDISYNSTSLNVQYVDYYQVVKQFFLDDYGVTVPGAGGAQVKIWTVRNEGKNFSTALNNNTAVMTLSDKGEGAKMFKANGTVGVDLSGNYYNGYIMEILIYNRALSSEEVGQVHTYLNSKFSVY